MTKSYIKTEMEALISTPQKQALRIKVIQTDQEGQEVILRKLKLKIETANNFTLH